MMRTYSGKRVMGTKGKKTHSMREISGLHKRTDGGPGLPLMRSEGRGRQKEESSSLCLV